MTKRILSNIEEFAQKIYDLISEKSQERHPRMVSLFTETRERYNKECTLRARALEFDSAIAELNNFPDVINCLQLLAKFVSTGGWTSTSANTMLFLKLIDMTGYEREAEETDSYLREHVITELKKTVCKLIIKRVEDYDLEVKIEDEKNQILEVQRTIKLKNLDKILLSDSHELARGMWLANPEKTTFCLICNPVESEYKTPEWHLFFYDLQGRANFLPLGNELRSLLASLKISQLPSPVSDAYDQIKECCGKLLKESPDIYLFADGEVAANFSRKHPEKHSLCLSAVASSNESNSLKWRLTWYDLYGKPNQLTINDDLAKLTNALAVEQIPDSDTLLYFEIKKQCALIVNDLHAKVKVLINPEPDALRGLEGTYVLTWQLPTIKLYWYDKLGIRQEILLNKYPALNVWLQEQSQLTTEQISRLKTYLMHLNVRREVVEKKQVLDFLQKKHGITLIAANDITKIPAFRLVQGVYILVREPLDKTGEWALYLRHKGNVNERINIDHWEDFNQILLNNNELMPNDLSVATKNTLRDTIVSSLSLFEDKKRLCVAVNEFLPEHGSNYRVGSFVITKANNIWALYYINALQKVLPVDLKTCPAQALIEDLKGEPSSLKREKLDELDQALANFKPASHLDTTNFSKVSRMLSARNSSDQPRVKLNMNNYAAIGRLFGTVPSDVKTVDEVAGTNKLGS